MKLLMIVRHTASYIAYLGECQKLLESCTMLTLLFALSVFTHKWNGVAGAGNHVNTENEDN